MEANYLNTVENNLVKIPSGTITLRDDRLKKEWISEIQEFFISRYLVTQQLYLSVTGKAPATFNGKDRPVETVTWIDAAQFCNLLSEKGGLEKCYTISDPENIIFDVDANGYRLPSDGEWQYACKAGNPGIRYGDLDDIAWYKGNSGGETHDVGTKNPNDWGLYDMIGNVWEWCSDVYDSEIYGAYRVLRGGGWYDEPRSCMATNRRRSHPSAFEIDDVGFRIARNL